MAGNDQKTKYSVINFGSFAFGPVLFYNSQRAWACRSEISKKERDRLVEENKKLARENQAISVEIDRLKHDPLYIESIARQELGMIGEDEIILKPQSLPEQKK